MLFVIIWFFVDAHKWFKGPKINIEVSQAAVYSLKRTKGEETNLGIAPNDLHKY